METTEHGYRLTVWEAPDGAASSITWMLEDIPAGNRRYHLRGYGGDMPDWLAPIRDAAKIAGAGQRTVLDPLEHHGFDLWMQVTFTTDEENNLVRFT